MVTSLSGVTTYFSTTEIIRAAKAALEAPAWDYIVGGSETETALARNRDAIERLAFRARVLRNVETVDTTTTLLGTALSIPYILAPVGAMQTIHPDGALGQVRAACGFGTLPVVSSVTAPSFEESSAAAAGDKWFQLYVRGDIEWIEEIVGRVRDAGYRALVMTVDVAHYSNRERQLQHQWATGGPRVERGRSFQAALDWEAIERIRTFAGMPVIVKGIQCAQDAQVALDCGVAAVWVSNHGGRQLDHALGSLDVLPEVVGVVGGRVPVIVDGGFMRGTDIIKGIALGADVVACGKMHAWALGAGGEAAVTRMLELVADEIATTMGLLGVRSLAELDETFIARTATSMSRGPFPLL